MSIWNWDTPLSFKWDWDEGSNCLEVLDLVQGQQRSATTAGEGWGGVLGETRKRALRDYGGFRVQSTQEDPDELNVHHFQGSRAFVPSRPLSKFKVQGRVRVPATATSTRTAPATTGHTLHQSACFLLALGNLGGAISSKVCIPESKYTVGNTNCHDHVFSTWQSGLDLRSRLSGNIHTVLGWWLSAYETVWRCSRIADGQDGPDRSCFSLSSMKFSLSFLHFPIQLTSVGSVSSQPSGECSGFFSFSMCRLLELSWASGNVELIFCVLSPRLPAVPEPPWGSVGYVKGFHLIESCPTSTLFLLINSRIWDFVYVCQMISQLRLS